MAFHTLNIYLIAPPFLPHRKVKSCDKENLKLVSISYAIYETRQQIYAPRQGSVHKLCPTRFINLIWNGNSFEPIHSNGVTKCVTWSHNICDLKSQYLWLRFFFFFFAGNDSMCLKTDLKHHWARKSCMGVVAGARAQTHIFDIWDNAHRVTKKGKKNVFFSKSLGNRLKRIYINAGRVSHAYWVYYDMAPPGKLRAYIHLRTLSFWTWWIYAPILQRRLFLGKSLGNRGDDIAWDVLRPWWVVAGGHSCIHIEIMPTDNIASIRIDLHCINVQRNCAKYITLKLNKPCNIDIIYG